MKSSLKLIALIIAALALLTLFGCGQKAKEEPQKAAENKSEASKQGPAFPDHNLTYIVPYSVGGGYDTYGRMQSQIMSEKLGQPVVVRNDNGGNGVIGVNNLYNSAPDGYTIGVMSGGAVMPQLVGKANYDLNKFSWVGIMSTDYYVTATSPKSNIKSLEDLKGKEVRVGITGFGTIDGVASLIMGEKMGYKVKTIANKGSQDNILGAMRGDIDLVTYTLNNLDPIKAGDLVPLWISAPERLPELPDVPTLKEIGYPELGELLVLPRPVAAPPGVPDDVLKVLREAFNSTLDDPRYVKLVVEQNKASIVKAKPEDVAQTVQKLMTSMEPYKEVIASAWK